MPGAEDEPTLRDQSSTRSATSSTTRSGWTHAPSVSATLLGPMQTLHLEEVRRIRAFALMTIPFGGVVALLLPFTEHDPFTLRAMLSGLALYVAVTVFLLRSLKNAQELPVLPVMFYGLGCLYAATTGIYYFGLFSPAVMGITLGLFFFSPSTSFPAAFAIYASGATMHAALATAILSGALADRGVVRAPELGTNEQVLIQILVQGVFLVSFVIGRVTRAATLSAIQAHDEAMQQLERRDELLAEARHELAEALGAGKLGHYSDQQLGDFVLGEVIGRGAMGEVYKALHAKSGELAAVKLLHRHALSDPEYVLSFIREAKTAASIDSPHVCRVIEVGGLDAPLPYMAMELLSGQDLAELLRARPRLSLRDVVRLLKEAGEGLDAARAAGIAHRDINPRNLFAAETPTGTSWKLLDFGVAKPLAAGTSLPGGEVAGTPQYMAPELALGRALSHRADLFSLAAVAYRALTGQAPFSGTGVPDTLLHVVHGMPARPSELVRVPEEVDLVMAVALAKDPERRFDSGAELARAFEHAARGEIDAELRRRAEELLHGLPWRAKVA